MMPKVTKFLVYPEGIKITDDLPALSRDEAFRNAMQFAQDKGVKFQDNMVSGFYNTRNELIAVRIPYEE